MQSCTWAHRADVGRVLVFEHVLDLLHSGLEFCQSIDHAEACAGSSRVARHPWFDVIDVVVNLIDTVVPGLESNACLRVIERSLDVLIQHVLEVERGGITVLLHG